MNINNIVKNINPNYIYVDVDGVLLHSCQAICDIINEKQGTNFTGNQILSWNFKEICPNLSDKEVEDMFADPIFFQYVEWIDGAKEFLFNHENNVIIVTKGTEENIKMKKIFFESHNLDKIPIIGIPLNGDKSWVNMSNGLFIDDCTINLNCSNAKYKVQFLEYNDELNENREWIKGFDGIKVSSWY